METNPLMARRVIPLRERLQKSLLVLLAAVLAAGAVWYLAGASAEIGARFVLLIGAIAALGLVFALYFAFKTYDRAETRQGYRSVRLRIEDDREGRGWLSRLYYNLKRFLTGVVVAMGLLVALAGVGVVALQAYGYLKAGSWQSISLLSAASQYVPWLSNPQSWFGLNKIVRDAAGLLPLSLALVLLGVLIAGFGSALRQRVAR